MMLDEVAWLFNLQGSDIDFNSGELGRPRVVLRKVYMLMNLFFPVSFAYTVITAEKILLFIHLFIFRQEQLNDAVWEYLDNHIEIRPYNSFFDYLTKEGLLEL